MKMTKSSGKGTYAYPERYNASPKKLNHLPRFTTIDSIHQHNTGERTNDSTIEVDRPDVQGDQPDQVKYKDRSIGSG